jgi:hypothetical protein
MPSNENETNYHGQQILKSKNFSVIKIAIKIGYKISRIFLPFQN